MTTRLSELVLTRYLYNKALVIESLQKAIDENVYNDALYWAYEIYYSGFEDELVEFIMLLFENRYKHHVKLRSYIQKKYKANRITKDPTFVATILKNMNIKNYKQQETVKPRYIIVKADQIEEFKTLETTNHKWKVLQTMCKKPVTLIKNIKKTEAAKLLKIFRSKWIYYASRSPIWKARILEYHGKIDGRKKTVEFKNDDDLEGFHDKYDYEPDEQPLNIQKGCMGIPI